MDRPHSAVRPSLPWAHWAPRRPRRRNGSWENRPRSGPAPAPGSLPPGVAARQSADSAVRSRPVQGPTGRATPCIRSRGASRRSSSAALRSTGGLGRRPRPEIGLRTCDTCPGRPAAGGGSPHRPRGRRPANRLSAPGGCRSPRRPTLRGPVPNRPTPRPPRRQPSTGRPSRRPALRSAAIRNRPPSGLPVRPVAQPTGPRPGPPAISWPPGSARPPRRVPSRQQSGPRKPTPPRCGSRRRFAAGNPDPRTFPRVRATVVYPGARRPARPWAISRGHFAPRPGRPTVSAPHRRRPAAAGDRVWHSPDGPGCGRQAAATSPPGQ